MFTRFVMARGGVLASDVSKAIKRRGVKRAMFLNPTVLWCLVAVLFGLPCLRPSKVSETVTAAFVPERHSVPASCPCP
ncbi:hypothetical protein HYH03_018051 [Edaphochlamys debaryana]|uniref:Uncharacterized protein n=1 Tax=Edaphochlamys debaryana TaxID=47281 RepID=A0A835XHV4_9CHLO|nr:hypothetical protein HYH03_018051 [Edaphochlamys debaryana]|eukprot:KAG2483068.1 hypothetical protein HYH03_018051 [Edaphochlamys debaryana]